ncbi:Peroxisomal membrane protein PMP47B [Smittium culicis]|uniref:Peroxisomal membrane protein PMP47B n=1 Tax=Smittium culicis TaxID=133412 RepID=A0A1R1WXY2_9FUNG|nr:Peroxisomal membrane protein PMP47B [Smittium culicis]OMJ07664.1 Peroxisomal membrane protein PMP47B [Smittium culicis]
MSDNLVHAVAGAGGGIISMALTYPLITISSRLQVQRSQGSSSEYTGNVDAFNKILKNEGVSGLFSGLESALFGAALTNGVYYYFFEATKKHLATLSKRKTMNTVESLISGAIAGAMTSITTNPIWVINTRLTVKDPNSKAHGSTLEEFKQIVKNDGFLSLWQGIGPALILVLNPIIQYSLFEQIKNHIAKSRKLNSLDFFLLGALSKLAATSITYPYIVVKSRMQMRQSKDNSDLRYDSISDGFKKILSNEGIKGLYKGIESKLIQSVLTAALLFMSKEALYKQARFALSLLTARNRRR